VVFDPYHQWLGIPKDKRPPTHYQILGIAPDERSHYVIRGAAERQRQYVLSFEHGIHRAKADEVLGAIADAEIVLLDEIRRRDYDSRLNILHSQQKKNWERLHSHKYRIAGYRVHPIVAYLWMPFRLFFQLFELNTNQDAPRSESVFSIPLGVTLVLAVGILLMVGSLWLPWKKYIHQANAEAAIPTTEAGIAHFMFKVDPEDLTLDTTGMWAIINGTGKERKVAVEEANGISELSIKASREGYTTWTKTLNPQPGENTVIEVRLTRQITTDQNPSSDGGDIPDFFKTDDDVPIAKEDVPIRGLHEGNKNSSATKPTSALPSFFEVEDSGAQDAIEHNHESSIKNTKPSVDFFSDN